MELLIASNNQHKIEEIKAILKGKFDKIYCLDELGIKCDPEENGETFLENALIKAKAIRPYASIPILADDTGLCVDALGGMPGIRSARYAGDHDHAKNRRKLLQELDGIEDRSAHFETVLVLLYPDGKVVTASGQVCGQILQQEDGTNGFGYDSIFYSLELNKSFGLASPEEKNAASHRARALMDLLSKI